MNRNLVIAEWIRAAQCLGAAHSCVRDGFYADAVSRAYYAILHGAKAALQLRDVAAGSHAGIKRMFGLHVVQTGLVEAQWGTLLGDTADARLTAEYDVETPFTKSDALEACDDAKSFLGRIRDLLLAHGISTQELPTGDAHA